jgi:hypothetical protein
MFLIDPLELRNQLQCYLNQDPNGEGLELTTPEAGTS